MDFVIDRSKWRCGGVLQHRRGEGAAVLVNDHGYMCCLGQIGVQLGADPQDMLMVAGPSNARKKSHALGEALALLLDGHHSTDFASDAMAINDDSQLDDATREDALVKLAKKHGHTITFTGEYA